MPSRRNAQRGSTLIELLLVAALQIVVLGAVASLYLFTVQQCGQATAAVGPVTQAIAAMDAIKATVRESMVCATQSQGAVTGLRCTLPANAQDTDGDGVDDQWLPDQYDAKGNAKYTKGKRVWFYQADATGAFGTSGTILWRATRNDDNKPTAADADKAWALYYNGAPRYGLIDAMTVTVGGKNADVTVTLAASASARKPDASGATATTQDTQGISLTQMFSWRTDFE